MQGIHSEELLEEFEVKSIAISWDNFQGGSHFIEIYKEKVEKSSLELLAKSQYNRHSQLQRASHNPIPDSQFLPFPSLTLIMRINRDTHNPNTRDRTAGDASASLLLRASSDAIRHATTSSDFVLQWGNRKRLRCMKIQVKDKGKDDSDAPVTRTTVRVDRRVVRPDKDPANQPSTAGNSNQTNGYLNLRQRPLSPQQPPLQRVLRNSETTTSAMRGQSNGGLRGIVPPDNRGGAHDKKGNHHHHNHHHHNNENNNTKSAASSDTAHDSKKGGGGSSSGSGEAALAPPMVWPPKFVIALTNKEKEEDFMAIKGSKLPQRPKKRAKFIQRTLNKPKKIAKVTARARLTRVRQAMVASFSGKLVLHVAIHGCCFWVGYRGDGRCVASHLVSPGAWLCDLTLERYEVREKKISKKRPRGLKAMGNVESDSE
ncbi:Protein of unknown function D [Prunus dulcis]|uniref:Uncharacterized protein n=1 Tax=Prunus dulcis TaxID=3755 RepID=A0A4Y1QTI3_PRUDU|nr:Protein of unknown function D [Prunus dulcis]